MILDQDITGAQPKLPQRIVTDWDLGKSLPKVEQVAISALDDADLEVANDAAPALGRWGTAKTETALWTRLKHFHREWQGRDGELLVTPDALPR